MSLKSEGSPVIKSGLFPAYIKEAKHVLFKNIQKDVTIKVAPLR